MRITILTAIISGLLFASTSSARKVFCATAQTPSWCLGGVDTGLTVLPKLAALVELARVERHVVDRNGGLHTLRLCASRVVGCHVMFSRGYVDVVAWGTGNGLGC